MPKQVEANRNNVENKTKLQFPTTQNTYFLFQNETNQSKSTEALSFLCPREPKYSYGPSGVTLREYLKYKETNANVHIPLKIVLNSRYEPCALFRYLTLVSEPSPNKVHVYLMP